MKVYKIFVMIAWIIIYTNCNSPHDPYQSDSEGFYFESLNGNTKDIIVNDNMLYVANSEEALKIYEISNGRLALQKTKI